jgi:hypothetical protein
MLQELEIKFTKWLATATDVELEMFVANPQKGVSLFPGCGYNHVVGTNEGPEYVVRARSEINRRQKVVERKRWRVTTLIGAAAIIVAGVNLTTTLIEKRPWEAHPVAPCGPSAQAPAGGAAP